jgi:hypothetical protein
VNDSVPVDPADDVARRRAALTAFRSLGEEDREILRLLAWDGLSSKEAAVVLGITATSFRVRLHRARRRLKVAISAQDAEGPEPLPTLPTERTRVKKTEGKGLMALGVEPEMPL